MAAQVSRRMAELLAAEQERDSLKARIATLEHEVTEALVLARQMQALWTEHLTGRRPVAGQTKVAAAR